MYQATLRVFFYFKKHGYKFIKGKKDGPYATLNGALDNIRTLRRSNKSYQHVFIFLRGGNYRIFEQTIIKVNVFLNLLIKFVLFIIFIVINKQQENLHNLYNYLRLYTSWHDIINYSCF